MRRKYQGLISDSPSVGTPIALDPLSIAVELRRMMAGDLLGEGGVEGLERARAEVCSDRQRSSHEPANWPPHSDTVSPSEYEPPLNFHSHRRLRASIAPPALRRFRACGLSGGDNELGSSLLPHSH